MSNTHIATSIAQSPSPRSNKANEDFLASHLSGLLVRQPSLSQSNARHGSSNSANAPRHSSKSESRQSSIPASGSAGSRSGSFQEDVFSSFLRQTPYDEQLEDVSQRPKPTTSSNPKPIKRGSAASEPAPSVATLGCIRSGPSSVSMSISFGRRRGKASRSNADLTSSDGGSIVSGSSYASDYKSAAAVPLTSPPIATSALREYMPGKLGDANSRHYPSSETVLTTPSSGGMSSGNPTEKGASTEWNPAFLQYRRPSISPSIATSSPGSNSSPPSTTSVNVSGIATPQSMQSRKDEEQRKFDDGSSIEPPDTIEDMPDLANHIRSGPMAKSSHASSFTGNAKFSSMTTKRHSPRRMSRVDGRNALSNAESSYDDFSSYDGRSQVNAGSQANTGSTPRGLGSEAGSVLTSSLDSMTARMSKDISTSESAAKLLPASEANGGATNQASHSTATRKQSVTLVPSGDDGRTFRFVTVSQ